MLNCPWCTEQASSGEAMMNHVQAHDEAEGVVCGTCWLPGHQPGPDCIRHLVRHILTWRRDHTPNPREGTLWGDRAEAWHQHTRRLWLDAEAIHATTQSYLHRE